MSVSSTLKKKECQIYKDKDKRFAIPLIKRVLFTIIYIFLISFISRCYADTSRLQNIVPWFQKSSIRILYDNPDFWNFSSQDFFSLNSTFPCRKISGYGKSDTYQPLPSLPFIFFGFNPADVSIEFSNENKLKRITVNCWNKGDVQTKKARRISPFRQIDQTLKQFLKDCKKSQLKVEHTVKKISSKIKEKVTRVHLGPTLLTFQIEPREYIFLHIEKNTTSKKKLNIVQQKIKNSKRTDYGKQKTDFRNKIKRNVITKPNGDRIIQGIPMINQGEKGYCVPATCARIMQYYDFDTNEHELAKIMGTTATTGTNMRRTVTGLKRLDSGLPIYYKPISFSKGRIARYIDKGVPIIWIIPGHCRLIFGYNDKEGYLYYSDSWGQKGLGSKMSMKKAKDITRFMCVLK